MIAARRNLEHAIANACADPDCEIHHPDIIETESERLTAVAWFLAGALAGPGAARGLADEVRS